MTIGTEPLENIIYVYIFNIFGIFLQVQRKLKGFWVRVNDIYLENK